jgi:Flp pilus assembly protein TadD
MRCFIAASLLALNLCAAEPRWIRLQTDSFEIYSTGSETNSRETLRQFEEVRAFFPRGGVQESQKSARIRIIAFNSQKEFEPYRFNEYSTAYYKKSAERDTIVMSRLGPETRPIAIHEYVHLVAQRLGLKAPPWFNEGLAELYSTLRPIGDKTMVGDLIRERMRSLLVDKWVPLAVILAADQTSPYYNEKNKAGSLYNEGWALTHMLLLSDEYRPHSDAFMRAMLQGKDSVEALTAACGKPLAAIEKDLQAYLRGNRFHALVFPTKLDQSKVQAAAEPAPMFEVRMLLVDLTDRPGNTAATREQLERLAREAPSQPEPHTQLGYLLWRGGDNAQAETEFEKSYSLGGRSARMLWDYGRMIEVKNPKKAIQVLQDLLDQEPARQEAQIELASALYQDNQTGEAMRTLAKLPSVTPDEAPRYFSLAAYIALKMGDRTQAKRLAEMSRDAQKATPEDKARAQQLLAFLDNAREIPPAYSASEVKTRLGQATVSGKLVEFLCEDLPKLVLETPAGKKTLLIERTDRIVITGRTSARADLECGPQHPALPVEVEYDQPQAGAAVDGVVRAIIFSAPQ